MCEVATFVITRRFSNFSFSNMLQHISRLHPFTLVIGDLIQGALEKVETDRPILCRMLSHKILLRKVF